MTQRRTWIIISISTAVLVIAIWLVAVLTPTCSGNNGSSCLSLIPNNPAAIFTVISLTAVGIERVIEGFWSIIELSLGKYWPLNLVTQPLTDLTNNLNNLLDPFYVKLNTIIDSVPNLDGEKKIAVKAQINQYQVYIKKLKQLPGDKTRATLLASAAEQSLNQVHTIYNGIDQHTTDINAALKDLQGFLGTFQDSTGDNPGRRIISLYFGIVLGIILAAILNLNLLPLVLTQNSLQHLPLYLSFFGVILTGIVMGLGSSPTHEVIQAIQEFKQNQQSPTT